MRSGRILLGAAFVALVALLTQAGCLSEPKEPLRIGVNAWPPFELLYLAREKGFFKDEGVEVDLVDFSSYTGILRSYHQGNIDGFLATLNEILITENFQDLPAVILVADYSYGGDALVTRDGIADLAALKGKTIAYEESALGSYMLERALETAGLKPDQVSAVNRLPDEGEEDFRHGKVDAAITYEPGLGRMLRLPGSRVLFSSRDIPGEIVDVLALRRAALEGRGDEARRVLKAWFRALAYFADHSEECAALMARRQHVSVEEFLRGLKGAHIPDLRENKELLGTAQTPGTLHQTADRIGQFLVRHGLAEKVGSGSDLFHPEIVGSL
jgi:NitT/TauT family transport system substrate-binding protein